LTQDIALRDNVKDRRKEPPVETTVQRPASVLKTSAVVLAALLVLGIAVYAASVASSSIAPRTPIRAVTLQEHAWYACTAFIAEQLKLSVLEAQQYNSGGVATVSGATYQAKVHYAKQGSTYLCEILHTPSGNWQLLSLKASH
jgi:hypothetical protein